MRTCAATDTRLHLIKPLGFSLDESYIKRSGANYIKDCDYTLYESWDDFKSKNKGTYYYLTRYGKKPHTSFDYSNRNENIYFVFGKESSGIPLDILKNDTYVNDLGVRVGKYYILPNYTKAHSN